MMVWRTSTLRGSRDVLLLDITKSTKKTIFHKMCVHWNEIPLKIRSLETVEQFKRQLKTFYFNTAFTFSSGSDCDSSDTE